MVQNTIYSVLPFWAELWIGHDKSILFLEPILFGFVPASTMWDIWRLAIQIRKFAGLLQFSFLSKILNCLYKFIRKHRPHRPNCPSEGFI